MEQNSLSPENLLDRQAAERAEDAEEWEVIASADAFKEEGISRYLNPDAQAA